MSGTGAIAAQLDAVRDYLKRMEAVIVAVAKMLLGFESLISIKGTGGSLGYYNPDHSQQH